MLVVFYGTDRTNVRNEAALFLGRHMPNIAADTIDGTTAISGELATLVDAQSLFGGVEAYIIDTPSANSEFETEVTEHLAAMEQSNNIFIVLESSMLAAARKKYERHAKEMKEFVADKAERFNTFALADALSKKDKKNLWVLLQEAMLAGLRPEEIIGVLWWQLKALRLAAVTGDASEAGMKEYPFKKAKSALRNFNDGEIEHLAQSLLVLYHQGHQGLADMELKLEEWVLQV